MVALRAKVDKIILGGMGMTNDDYYFFKNTFSNAGALDRIIAFMNTTEDPAVERLLVPDMALTAAECRRWLYHYNRCDNIVWWRHHTCRS